MVTRHLALVDHRDHQAFVVLDGDRVVAVAQWDRSRGRTDEAEIAVTVDEEWQHRGLGRALMSELAVDARAHGVTTLVASVLADNRPALGLAARYRPSAAEIDGAERHFTFQIPAA
jgi:ribosomal protein S18 acetylase RimI-like enzyme